jgi:hypothetical protein
VSRFESTGVRDAVVVPFRHSKDWTMEPLTPLARHAQELPPDWKWMALFAPPSPYEDEWRSWLAHAQQAEQTATLHYWASRVDNAA